MTHSERWTIEKITRRLKLIEPLVYHSSLPLPPFRYMALSGPLETPPVGLDVDDHEWHTVEPDRYWSAPATDFVLRTHFQRPLEWDAAVSGALYLPLGIAGDFSHPEALAYLEGKPYAAVDRHHQEIALAPEHVDGRPHLLALHGWTGVLGSEPGTQLLMRRCAIVQIDQPTRDFVALARVALGAAASLDGNDPARGRLLNALDEAFTILDTREPFEEHFYASVAEAHAALWDGVAQAGPPLDVDIVAAGHAHIDVAWLWTLGEARHKAGRTFHTVLRLMEQFPEYHFTQSQPQLYDTLRQDYPEAFAAIQQRVAEGRWEPIGGMWVEADCNLSGAESLARQFLLGRRFFREYFGPEAESPVLWLPDVFGYTWNLPQLIKQAGLDYFFTIKIGWSQYNRLPYDSFWWQGLDGTRVLTHFGTTPETGSHHTSTYNAKATPEEIRGTWTNLSQKELQREQLMAFGYGDGGGGPTREMLENIRAMKAFPAMPRVRCGTVAEFFHRLEGDTGQRLPIWNGELYLEGHRGTYTTQSRTKRANRKAEFLLHNAEFLAALACWLDPDYRYPQSELRRAWELVCLNQFHDIIPGSSIGAVYAESQQQYAEIQQIGERARGSALAVIVSKSRGDLVIVNPTSFVRSGLAFWNGGLADGKCLRSSDGAAVIMQPASGGMWIALNGIGPYSITPLFIADKEQNVQQESLASITATPSRLENSRLRVELNTAGDIVRIYDKTNDREVLPPDAIGNQFQAFEDRPLDFDAWDIDIFFDDKMWASEPATSIAVAEAGPLHSTLEIKRRILHSEVVQRISLSYDSSRLDFDTTIDWRERHILLKVAFPVQVLSPMATYDIQWGNVQRPTHRNTSWDWARFETCAHKWVDLSEGGYGVSLLNDCKYGHDIRDNVLRLSLLRSSTYPDPEADQGEHRFAYSLLPHAGGWDETTIAAAYALNDPLIVAEATAGGAKRGSSLHHATPFAPGASWLSVDRPNVVIETVKQAEDAQGLIVRLYESQRCRGPVTLITGFALAGAWRTNLLEENEASLATEEDRVSFNVRPYEIITLRLIAGKPVRRG